MIETLGIIGGIFAIVVIVVWLFKVFENTFGGY